MSSSSLLEQAIVDAQALRDSAYKSAQAALIEKFAPEIKQAVQKLLEQEEDPAAADPTADPAAGGAPPPTDFGGAPPDESNKGYVAGTAKDIPLAATDGEKLCPCPDKDEEVTLELNLADLADQLKIGKEAEEEEEPGMEPQMTGMQNQPPAAGGAAGSAPIAESIELDESLFLDEDGEEGDAGDVANDKMYGIDDATVAEEFELEEELDEELTEVNLDEVLAEEHSVEEGISSEHVKHEASGKKDPDCPICQGDYDVDEQKLSPKQKQIAKLSGDPNKIDAGDLAKLRAKKNTNESKEVEQTKQLIKASTALLKEVENKDAKINKLLEENNKLSSTVEDMSIAFKKLEEVNTLNARLFYENQVLKSASLNERQKTNIVEAISKADSVSEAKTVYETLINSVGGQADKERSPKSLNEAISKKSSFRLPHKPTEQPNDSNKDRWLKLAGIK